MMMSVQPSFWFPPEDGKAGLDLPIVLGCRHQHANSSCPARLLRPPANSWPCGSSAECRNELSPFHVPPPRPWGILSVHFGRARKSTAKLLNDRSGSIASFWPSTDYFRSSPI